MVIPCDPPAVPDAAVAAEPVPLDAQPAQGDIPAPAAKGAEVFTGPAPPVADGPMDEALIKVFPLPLTSKPVSPISYANSAGMHPDV